MSYHPLSDFTKMVFLMIDEIYSRKKKMELQHVLKIHLVSSTTVYIDICYSMSINTILSSIETTSMPVFLS
jgi:hypothetical protein